MSDVPLVSVVISNYNYEGFLGEAVDSALGQSYPNVEAVVVDDGSTDGSREVIASYSDRCVTVLKDNAGQASACNAGFRACNGEIVIFLDADDLLLPDTVEKVVGAFRSKPAVAKVHARQLIIDDSGKPTGEIIPPARLPLHSGDLRQRLIDLNTYFWPSTSGNAFATAVLREIMPIPEALYRGMPDIYLCNLSAVFGEVASLETPGTLYRVHGGNNFFDSLGLVNLEKLRRILLAIEHNHMKKKALFSSLYSVDTHTIGPRDITWLRGRMLSLRLEPRKHPFEETLWGLFLEGCKVSVGLPDPDMSRGRRMLYLLWFAAMLVAPKPLARRLAAMFFTYRKGLLYDKLLSLTEIDRREVSSERLREPDLRVRSGKAP